MNWNPDIGIPLAIAGALVLIAIAVFGRPRKPRQGRRLEAWKDAQSNAPRREPRLGDEVDGDEADPHVMANLPDGVEREADNAGSQPGRSAAGAAESGRGRRGDAVPQRIVTLFVAAREDELIDGSDIVVAAEKAGLVYGHMGIFHRLVEGEPDAEPIFSVANMVKPGHFDLRQVHDIETPGLTFFMTLPGPVPALDAWEAMLPTAQRLADMLNANVLDEQRNALGRQGIAHIRGELRNFDREQQKEAERRW